MARTEETAHRTPHHASFDITGIALEHALKIAFNTSDYMEASAKGWATDRDGKRLILFRSAGSDSGSGSQIHPLPSAMGLNRAIGFVQDWLDSVDYGPEPDTDGSTGNSCRVYAERWGQIDGHGWASFVAIEPEWIVYGK